MEKVLKEVLELLLRPTSNHICLIPNPPYPIRY
jgi:hypothetical protein